MTRHEHYFNLTLRKAMAVYEKEECDHTFDEAVQIYLRNGIVLSRPDFFVMARPVRLSAPPSEIIDGRVVFNVASCDSWYIHLMAGNMVRAIEYVPFILPYFSFQRRNVLRTWPFARIEELINKLADESI